jgi:hypothetical protein
MNEHERATANNRKVTRIATGKVTGNGAQSNVALGLARGSVHGRGIYGLTGKTQGGK